MSYQDLLNHSILSLEEINGLIKSAQQKCTCEEEEEGVKCIPCYDRETLIFHHMLLIRKVAGEFSKNPNTNVDEFMADGIIGLDDAIDEFDLEKSDKFFHFAENSIRWAITAGGLFGPLIKVPGAARRKIKKIIEKIDEFEAKGEPVSYTKICEDLDITRTRLFELLDIIKSKQRLYITDDQQDENNESYDRQVTKYHYDKDDWIYSVDLQPALNSLTDYQKKIILARYGIDGPERTIRQISRDLNQDYGKTRRDYHKAFDLLKKYFQQDIEAWENEQ